MRRRERDWQWSSGCAKLIRLRGMGSRDFSAAPPVQRAAPHSAMASSESRDGETGRRHGLNPQTRNGCGGSSPPPGTIKLSECVACKFACGHFDAVQFSLNRSSVRCGVRWRFNFHVQFSTAMQHDKYAYKLVYSILCDILTKVKACNSGKIGHEIRRLERAVGSSPIPVP